MCSLIEQVCVVGSGMPQPLALVVLSEAGLQTSKDELKNEISELLQFVNQKIEQFEKLNNIVVVNDEWSVETGILTPTMKIKRNVVEEKYGNNVEAWFNSDSIQFV